MAENAANINSLADARAAIPTLNISPTLKNVLTFIIGQLEGKAYSLI